VATSGGTIRIARARDRRDLVVAGADVERQLADTGSPEVGVRLVHVQRRPFLAGPKRE